MSGRALWNGFVAACGVVCLIGTGVVLSVGDDLPVWAGVVVPLAGGVWAFRFVCAYVSWRDR